MYMQDCCIQAQSPHPHPSFDWLFVLVRLLLRQGVADRGGVSKEAESADSLV